MKKIKAIKILKELYYNGLIPSNFTPEHELFEKAIQYIQENGSFNYNEFISHYA